MELSTGLTSGGSVDADSAAGVLLSQTFALPADLQHHAESRVAAHHAVVALRYAPRAEQPRSSSARPTVC